MSHDPDHFRFAEGRNGIAYSNDSPIDLSGREEGYDRPDLLCVGCGKTPSELQEYIDAASEEASDDPNMTPNKYVWQEEGTLNRENGHFLCTSCYVSAGCPSGPRGWHAP